MFAPKLIRRLGALTLLFAWSQVATANAVPHAIWCHITGSGPAADPAHAGHEGHTPAQSHHHHDGSASISTEQCSVPQLLTATAVAPDPIALPVITAVVGDPPVATLHSFISISSDFDTPPPRI